MERKLWKIVIHIFVEKAFLGFAFREKMKKCKRIKKCIFESDLMPLWTLEARISIVGCVK